jgi:hypothetical protein
MGGQLLPTPPGFHFFVSILILFSGIPLLFAQLLTAAFFSSVVVFPAYLISKRIWGKSNAGVLAAFFAAISALSLEMISWGGYTNVVSLASIVTILYLFLRDMNHPNIFNLVVGTLLFGGLILTHTFSLFVLFPVLIIYFIFLLIGRGRKLKVMNFLKKLHFFIISGALGVLIVSPWLIRVFSFYIGASTEGSFLGGVPDNRSLILANRTVDSMILGLFIALIPAFFLFKTYRKRYADSKSLLLIAWFVVPLVMTHAFIFGVFVDYSRFMYFIDFPGIIIVAGGLMYLFSYTSTRFPKLARKNGNRAKKLIPIIVFVAILVAFILISPWSILPNDSQQRADFYTTIQQSENTTIAWIRNKTPESAVLVADHLYGWWLSGISKRATLSAAGLEFLLYAQEMEIARDAQFLLDTDYYIENGVMQIRDDGPYISRHNPLFSVETSNGEVFPVIYFKDNETVFEYERTVGYGMKTLSGNITLSDIEITETSLMEYENLTILRVIRENNLFTVNKTLQVQRGVGSVELSYDIIAKEGSTNIYAVNFAINAPANENIIQKHNKMVTVKNVNANVTPIFLVENSHQKNVGLIIPPQAVCSPRVYNNSNYVEINYNPQSYLKISRVNLKFFVEVYADLPPQEYDPVTIWDIWNYKEMLQKYDVTHVVCRDQSVYSKFSEDPIFQLVFNSGRVAVFQVIN